MKFSATLGLTMAFSCSTLSAQTERDLDSHVHGAAAMNVGIFESNVFIELTSPWNNLVGFEHEPESEEEHHALEEANKLLNDPNQLFSFDAGDCRLIDTTIESTLSTDDHKEHGDGDHDDDDHKEHGDGDHDDDDHKEHGDGDHGDEAEAHDDHGDEKESHQAVVSSYNYQCENVKDLQSISVLLFSIWPGFTDIDVQMAGENGQSFAELNADSSTLDINQIR